jgi:hypothetical protein
MTESAGQRAPTPLRPKSKTTTTPLLVELRAQCEKGLNHLPLSSLLVLNGHLMRLKIMANAVDRSQHGNHALYIG